MHIVQERVAFNGWQSKDSRGLFQNLQGLLLADGREPF